jgi:hypothetical protein
MSATSTWPKGLLGVNTSNRVSASTHLRHRRHHYCVAQPRNDRRMSGRDERDSRNCSLASHSPITGATGITWCQKEPCHRVRQSPRPCGIRHDTRVVLASANRPGSRYRQRGHRHRRFRVRCGCCCRPWCDPPAVLHHVHPRVRWSGSGADRRRTQASRDLGGVGEGPATGHHRAVSGDRDITAAHDRPARGRTGVSGSSSCSSALRCSPPECRSAWSSPLRRHSSPPFSTRCSTTALGSRSTCC